MVRCQPDFAAGLRTPQAGIPWPGLRSITQPGQIADWHFWCDQLFTWPADQPRHATSICGDPVESNRPHMRLRLRTVSLSGSLVRGKQSTLQLSRGVEAPTPNSLSSPPSVSSLITWPQPATTLVRRVFSPPTSAAKLTSKLGNYYRLFGPGQPAFGKLSLLPNLATDKWRAVE